MGWRFTTCAGLTLIWCEAFAQQTVPPSFELLEFLGEWRGDEIVLDPEYERIQAEAASEGPHQAEGNLGGKADD